MSHFPRLLTALLFAALGAPAAAPGAPPVAGPGGGLTRAERIRAQAQIERVYHRHRLWPRDNPGPKPSFESQVPAGVIENHADAGPRFSAALERFWGVVITPEMLQAELARMARQTRDPAMLGELFAALGDDPRLAAECLARPALAGRLIRSRFAADPAIHAGTRARAEAMLRRAQSGPWAEAGGDYRRLRWVREGADPAARRAGDPEALDVEDREFNAARARLAPGRMSELQEDESGFLLERRLDDGATHFTVESLFVPKRAFDAWWDEAGREFDAAGFDPAPPTDDAPPTAHYRLPAIVTAGCDSWDDKFLIDRVPEARLSHTLVWTGSEVIVWGGFRGAALNSGGRYNPATDAWQQTSTGANVPDPHSGHVAVWTGSEMIVWGGAVSPVQNNSGGRYNPVTDSWQPTSLTGAAFAYNQGNIGIWSGTRMIVWGPGSGGRYDPSNDSWQGMSTTNAPQAITAASAVWTGGEMIVWGGQDGLLSTAYNTGSRYDPVNDLWTVMSTAGAPAGRASHTAVWSGAEMIVWGGNTVPGNAPLNSGGRYNPVSNTWTATTLTGAPIARTQHTAAWTGAGGVMIVWGGYAPSATNTGARYNPGTTPGTDSWSAVTLTGAPAARQSPSVWTGTEFVVWGGQGGSTFNSGGRYNPTADSWLPTGNGGVPAARTYHSGSWTGAEFIVWGGWGGGSIYHQTGGRYNPATATWTPTAISASTPAARRRHSAVWTGTELIIWGGQNASSSFLGTGGRYNPTTDSWTAVTATGAPTGRYGHTAVWTGTLMIIWGGDDVNSGYVNTGSRYSPSPESWNATTNNLSARRYHSAVWTGGEMIVWGGEQSTSPIYLNTGARYNPTGNSWTATTLTGAPGARAQHTAAWTGTQMIVWGGTNGGTLNTGAIYTPGATDGWTPTSTGAGVPSARSNHSAVWTGSRMIVWGGGTNTGANYAPATDGWQATAQTADTPSDRNNQAAAWTGSVMLVWGGDLGVYMDTGGRYNFNAPGSPADSLRGGKSTTLDWTWSAASGASAYHVKRCTAAGVYCAPVATVATPPSPSYSEALDANSYFYAVEAVNACGETP